MVTLSNLKKYEVNGWTRLSCSIEGLDSYCNLYGKKFDANEMWIATKNEYSEFLNDNEYDAFLLYAMYLSMYVGEPLYVKGKINGKFFDYSKKYLKKILLNWKPTLKDVAITCDEITNVDYQGAFVGASISGGVDSLSTIYDRYVDEANENNKITHLFYFNCGTNGAYEDKDTFDRFISRSKRMGEAASDIGLPIVEVDTNLHAFSGVLPDSGIWTMQHFANYSCVLAMERKIKKYYWASTLEFEEYYSRQTNKERWTDFGMYAEHYFLQYVRTDSVEIELNGAQYNRIEKTKLISKWEVSYKHLNVCNIPSVDGENCSCCEKCFRTMLPLKNQGNLENYNKVFDLDKFERYKFKYKCQYVSLYNKDIFAQNIVEECRTSGENMPNVIVAKIVDCPRRLRLRVAKFVYKKLGREGFNRLKKRLKHNS